MLLIEMMQNKGYTSDDYHRLAKTLTRVDLITLKK